MVEHIRCSFALHTGQKSCNAQMDASNLSACKATLKHFPTYMRAKSPQVVYQVQTSQRVSCVSQLGVADCKASIEKAMHSVNSGTIVATRCIT